MKKLYLFITIGCVSLPLNLSAQIQNIQIEFKALHPYDGPTEPSVVINPNNYNEIAVGSVLDDYFYSEDGGLHWTSKTLTSDFGVYGDPVLDYDSKGRLYYFHLANYSQGTFIDRIVCQYTDHVSKPFSKGSHPIPNGTKAQDKQWIDINPKTNHIYMTWTQFDKYDSKAKEDSSIIMFSKSIDRGDTWTVPKRISFFAGDCLDGDNTVEGAVPVVGSDGSIMVVWTGPKGLVFQRSLDGGETWMKVEKPIMRQAGGWDLKIPGIYRCNGLPTLKIDRSGGMHNGAVYLSWCDQRKGIKNSDVWMIKSMNYGDTWSAPIKVNQDNGIAHQFFPVFTIDQVTGNLHWVYYDRRKYKSNELKTDVVWASSKDGGKTFQEEVISERPFIPQAKVFFGDYIAISAVNGRIRPVWVRMDMEKTSLWTAIITE